MSRILVALSLFGFVAGGLAGCHCPFSSCSTCCKEKCAAGCDKACCKKACPEGCTKPCCKK